MQIDSVKAVTEEPTRLVPFTTPTTRTVLHSIPTSKNCNYRCSLSFLHETRQDSWNYT